MSRQRKRQVRKRKVGDAATTLRPKTRSGARLRSNEFNPDYTYVIKDLRRIGLLAGTFLLIMIALSFILN